MAWGVHYLRNPGRLCDYSRIFFCCNLSLSLGVLRVILIKVIRVPNTAPHIPFIGHSIPTSSGAIPEMKRMGVHAIRSWDNLKQVSTRNFDGGNFGGGEADEVGEQAADDGGMSNDEEILLFALQFNQNWFKTDWNKGGNQSSRNMKCVNGWRVLTT